jgi:hypothetical protein
MQKSCGKPCDGNSPVAVFLAGHANSGVPAARLDLDADGLHRASDTILDAARERIAPVYNGAAAFEEQTCPPPAARHQRLLAFVEDKWGQLLHSEEAITDLVTRTMRCLSANVTDR